MLFFDLEFYVPRTARQQIRSSMIANPARAEHIVLGGSFFSMGLNDAVPADPQVNGEWIWDYRGDEKLLLDRIADRFEREWEATRSERARVLGKPVEDLVTCGAGISRFDLPALYCRGILHGIRSSAELFDLFLKTKVIELANVGSFLFPEDPTLYPKTTREMAGRLHLHERKASSKGVWDAYDAGDHDSIRQRTEEEVRSILAIYSRIQQRVAAQRR